MAANPTPTPTQSGAPLWTSPDQVAVHLDLVDAVRARLRVLAVFVGLGALLYLGLAVTSLIDGAASVTATSLFAVRVGTATLAVLAALGVLVVSRQAKLERTLESTAIAFVLAIAALAGLGRYDEAVLASGHSGWSGVSLLVVLLPVLVPVSPRQALVAGFAAASLDLGGFVIMAGVRGDPQDLPAYVMMFYGDFVAAGVAWEIARAVDDLRVKLHSARRLGRYELLERLSTGGMGEVWRARHGLLARPAAIKLIDAEVLDALDLDARKMHLARFEREAQATALLECPHTVDVYDFGVASDGTLYYAMEMLHGIDLHDAVLRHGSMQPERVAYLLAQVCESLAEAHARGLIHRDIKPSNLFLCCYGGRYDFIKVLDFGLVKIRERRSEASAPLTQGLTGTPAFLAPEQAMDDEEIDARTDIYLLGCVGYWLLTTHFVFEAKGAAQYVLKHVSEQPIPPGERVGQEFPAPLEALIMRALAKDPDLRPQTAEQFAAELEATGLAAQWSQVRARAWWNVHEPKL